MKLIALLLLLPCLSLGQGKSPLNPGRDFVLTDKEAVGMLPPKVICEFEASNMAWSPDGRYILLVRSDPKVTPAVIKQLIAQPKGMMPPEGEESVILVDVAKATSTKVWTMKSPVNRIQEVKWLPGTDTAFFTTWTTKLDPTGEASMVTDLYSLSASTAKVQPVLNGTNGDQISIYISPLLPTGVIKIQKFEQDENGGAATFKGSLVEILSNGRPGKRMDLPSQLMWTDVQWTADGARPLFGPLMPTTSPDSQPIRPSQFLFDFATGKVQPVTGLQVYRPRQDGKALYVDIVKGQAQSGDKTEPVNNAWLKSRFPSKMSSAIIVGDGMAVISPTEDAVLTFQQGIVMLRPLVRMPKELFESALLAAERTRLISDAKQCALAFIMYAADYDDTLPPGGGGWQDLIDPYLKNRQIMDGFNYTFGGGDMTKVQNPAETEMGYKQGVGGRAVAYLDGHVKWIPDK